jgi:hypothetical protein
VHAPDGADAVRLRRAGHAHQPAEARGIRADVRLALRRPPPRNGNSKVDFAEIA